METFDSLEFNPLGGGHQARMNFPNGYGVSVVQSPLSYTSDDWEWEVAVFKGDYICYDTHITDNVLGHCEQARVTEIMAQIQELAAD